ncbi:uncharacterized protein BP5553_00887 [Venustampulla echinocandica]|uniref:endo-1,3(4)-beta-glucanase n=1 Tax=Venustampulla echinocandica TaxID=2656787 RepID=A0A370TZI9_9HELO|nr:uncharacterized protein BP5553_00887 [Venustampulla echinocandica]RDL40908.1 hypothetical protein BP5553_00887 [Venustampulla echinocandica]
MASRYNYESPDGYEMNGPPAPKYEVDRAGTLAPRWYEYKHWNRRTWIGVGAVVVLVVVIIVATVAGVEVAKKNNRYPDYSKLTYKLSDTYSGENFFDQFDYFTGYDPTGGFVHYVPAEMAKQYNLTYASPSSAIVRVDTSVTPETVPNASTGRFSVRITSKKQYGINNLFIFDVSHTPIGCGTWPALWLTDPANWPENGEIDVMEAVNVVSSAANQIALHTSSGCSMGGVKRKESGNSLSSSCVNSTNGNEGCGVDAGTNTFGKAFNDQTGGITAMELRSAGIRVWTWARASIPGDISSGNPDPSTWGEATADYPNTKCNIDNHFRNQSIIANINLCGSWAGDTNVYSKTCSGDCKDNVANNPTAFKDAYWEFGSFHVYSAAA